MSGRGAWPRSGRGGTLKPKTGSFPVPGPYYLRATHNVALVGVAARNAIRDGKTPTLDHLAVHYGVRAIQQLLNRFGAKLSEDGVFGNATHTAVRNFQASKNVKVDGIVGPTSMRLLLLPLIKEIGGSNWTVVYGLLKNEGAFDPGAVGYVDETDLGLAQINTRAHPTYSVEQRFDPVVAVQFNVDYLKNALAALGNTRDAVLSYNLGIGGVRTWIKAGRPRYYSPDGGTMRDTTAYVDRVMNTYKEL